MRDVRTHADHVDILRRKELDIRREVVKRLSGQTAHHAGPNLVAASPQCAQTIAPRLPRMIMRMELRVEFPVRRLDAQEIAVRARFAPSAVCLLGLFAKAERDAERIAAERVDASEDVFEESRVRRAGQFAGLDHKVAVSRLERPFRLADDFAGIHPVAVDIGIRFPYAAVIAVLLADVSGLDETAEGHFLSCFANLDGIRGGKKRFGVRPGDQIRQFPMRQIARFPRSFVK